MLTDQVTGLQHNPCLSGMTCLNVGLCCCRDDDQIFPALLHAGVPPAACLRIGHQRSESSIHLNLCGDGGSHWQKVKHSMHAAFASVLQCLVAHVQIEGKHMERKQFCRGLPRGREGYVADMRTFRIAILQSHLFPEAPVWVWKT